MAHDPDAGLVKRGFILLGLIALLVMTVLFILFQGSRPKPAAPSTRAMNQTWSVAVPTAGFPASVSWAAVHDLAHYLPSPVGWEIRHNAAATLARRGSDQVPWEQFREMLDVERMTVKAREQLREDQEAPEASGRDLVLIALKALAEWHTRRREMQRTGVPAGLPAVYEIVDRLAESPDLQLSEQAKKTRETFLRS
jgi:hypothetical protein